MGLQLPKRARRVGLWAVVSAGMLMLGACSTEDKAQIRRLAMPKPATDRADLTYELWQWAWLAAILVGILVWGLILYAAFKFRRRSDDEVPVQTRYNLPIEILYTIAPIVMVLVFFFFTVKTEDHILAAPASANSQADHTVRVVGQQWSWTFNYLHEGAIGGRNVHSGGTTANEPVLYLPVNESVRLNLSSPDVIHSFWVPAFLFKMDVVPGRHNHFSFTPTVKGTFDGHCAELCGVYHSRMLFKVKVVSRAQYDAHLKQLVKQGNTGLALGGSDARTQAGLEQNTSQNGAGS